MSVTRAVKSIALHEHCENLMRVIHDPLQTLEEEMLMGYTNEDMILKCKPAYAQKLLDTVALLRSISAGVCLSVDVQNVASYGSNHLIPNDYHGYLYAHENLVSFVQASIFRTNQVALCLLTMERWICILKHSYESGDFFTAHAIVAALSKFEIARTDLGLYLSNTAKGILEYCQLIFDSMDRIHSLQTARYQRGDVVIPSLSVLPDQVAELPDNSQVEVTLQTCHQYTEAKNEIYVLYNGINKLLALHVIPPKDEWIEWIISAWDDKLKMHIANNAESISYILKDAKPKIDMNVVSMVFKFYDEPDRYYTCKRAVFSYVGKLQDTLTESVNNQFVYKCTSSIIDLLKNTLITTGAKLDYISHMLDVHVERFDKKIIALCRSIKSELQSLTRYENKFIDLEPDIKYVELEHEFLERWPQEDQCLNNVESPKSGGHRFDFFFKKSTGNVELTNSVSSAINRSSSFTLGYSADSGSNGK